jgi:hypothetical protein
MSASSLCGQHGPIQTVPTYPDDTQRHFSSARQQINTSQSVLRPAHKTNDWRAVDGSVIIGALSGGRLAR